MHPGSREGLPLSASTGAEGAPIAAQLEKRDADEELRPSSAAARVAASGGAMVARIALTLQAIALAAITGVILVAIVERYLLHHALLYEDDLITLLFVWVIFLGIGRATWGDGHLRLGLWNSVPPHARELITGVTTGAELALFGLFIYATVGSAGTGMQAVMPTLGVPVYVEYIAIGIGSALGVAALGCRSVAYQRHAWHYLTAIIVAVLTAWWMLSGIASNSTALLIMLVLLLLDVPIAIGIGLAGAAIVLAGDLATNLTIVIQQQIDSVINVAFIALPMFMILGGLVAQTGLATDLGVFLRTLFRRVPGGVGVASVGAAGILANMTGSPLADTSALGSVFIPELRKSGASREDAAALQACAGLLGMVFPPAVILIIWATVVGESVTDQFLAAIVPGLILAASMVVIVIFKGIRARRRHQEIVAERTTVRAAVHTGILSIPVLMIPAILDVGIFSGVFAPYESGAVAIAAAGGIGAARREIRTTHVPKIMAQAADTTTMVMIILATLGILKYGMFTSGIEASLGSLLSSTVSSTLTFWIVVNIAFLILHEFVEPTPAILLLVPFILPLAASLHISLLQLGVVIVINSTIGLVLPPLGVNLYLASKLANANSTAVLRKVWPYLGGSAAVLIAVCALPILSLILVK